MAAQTCGRAAAARRFGAHETAMAMVINNADLLERVLGHLESHNVLRLLLTCKRWKQAVLDAIQVWGWNPFARTLQVKTEGPHKFILEAPSCLYIERDPSAASMVRHVTYLCWHQGHRSKPQDVDITLVLGQLLGLRELKLDGTLLSQMHGSSVVQPLVRLTALSSLDVQELCEGIGALVPALRRLRGLAHLNLNKNSTMDEGTACELGEALQGLTLLTALHLRDNGIGEGAMQGLAAGLVCCRGLKFLDLHHNSLGTGGAAALAPALKAMTGLTYLQLCKNALGLEGAAVLAPVLATLRQLQYLLLDDNAVGPNGTVCLADALNSMSALVWLSLGDNALGVRGARALCPALRALLQLKALHLENNAFGDKGVRVLLDSLTAYQTRMFVFLDGNGMSKDSQKLLEATPNAALSRWQLRHSTAIPWKMD